MRFRIVVYSFILLSFQTASAANATGPGLGIFGAIVLFVLTAVVLIVKYLMFPVFCVYVCFWAIRKTRFYGNLISLGSFCQQKLPVPERAFMAIKNHKYISAIGGLLLWGVLVYLVTGGFSRL